MTEKNLTNQSITGSEVGKQHYTPNQSQTYTATHAPFRIHPVLQVIGTKYFPVNKYNKAAVT